MSLLISDPILLPQDGGVTIPFLLKEGRILDHQGILRQKEILVMPVGHILQGVEMMQRIGMTKIMLSKWSHLCIICCISLHASNMSTVFHHMIRTLKVKMCEP